MQVIPLLLQIRLRRLLIMLVLLSITHYCSAQITFKVEDVKKQDTLLTRIPVDSIFQYIYEPNLLLTTDHMGKATIKKPLTIYAGSQLRDSLIFYKSHPFLDGLFDAYKTHRPIVISPDMIWLLISQGFSHHVNFNAEKLRHHFVNFKGKKELVVTSRKLKLENPDAPWAQVFPEFTKQIAAYTGKDMVNTLTSNFTTTTPSSLLASQITIMDAMKQYFQYKVVFIGCGLPEVTLEGTPEDWALIHKKANQLRKYELDWWINRLEPILEEFIATSKGEINKPFWVNFIKKHEEKTAYGIAIGIDGSILQFYPYDKDGRKLDGKYMWNSSRLPDEIVKVPLKYEEKDDLGNIIRKEKLVIWSGFIGCSQNEKTKALKPEIGWMVAKAPYADEIAEKLKTEIKTTGGLHLNINNTQTDIPEELYSLKEIPKLTLSYKDDFGMMGTAIVPDRIRQINIKNLDIIGGIAAEAALKVFDNFPKAVVTINGKNKPYLENYLKEKATAPKRSSSNITISANGIKAWWH